MRWLGVVVALLTLGGCTTQRDVQAAYERGFADGEDEAQDEARRQLAYVQSDLDECRADLSDLEAKATRQQAQPTRQRAMTQEEYLAYCDSLEQSLRSQGLAKGERRFFLQDCRKFKKRVEDQERDFCMSLLYPPKGSHVPSLNSIEAKEQYPQCGKYY